MIRGRIDIGGTFTDILYLRRGACGPRIYEKTWSKELRRWVTT